FHLVDGQLQPSMYQIVNILDKGLKHVGYWTPTNGIKKKLHQTKESNDDLGAIIWPGDTIFSPKGWEIPTSSESKLRVGVPAGRGFVQFVDVDIDPKTRQVISVTGFCIDIFIAVMDALPYAVTIEFVPFSPSGVTGTAESYKKFFHEFSNGAYDVLAGDITILADRMDTCDFSLPYTEAGFSMVVPIKVDERKSTWIFMRPLETELWITIGAFFIYTGLVVWVVEHRVNKEFRGPPRQQVGTIFWFSFSTLVFAHREKLISNLSRFVVIVWVFVVLVLTSSYTASLTSMLTVQKLQPVYTDIDKIMRNGESVGYQGSSFVYNKLIGIGFDESKLKNYSNFEQYDKALELGSQNGGVSAIVDEIPYLKVFLAKYCTKYTMTGPTYKTAGFGFAFPKGSPLVADVSRAILQVTEVQIRNISNQWFGEPTSCNKPNEAAVTSDRLTLDCFKGLFIIAGLSSTSALLFFLLKFLYEVREMLVSPGSVGQKLASIAKTFDVFKDGESKMATAEAVTDTGFFSSDEGFSTTEPETPVYDTSLVAESTIEIEVIADVTST
nr:glutamate receptor 2.8-like [Tanacetum cinerariifolium]